MDQQNQSCDPSTSWSCQTKVRDMKSPRVAGHHFFLDKFKNLTITNSFIYLHEVTNSAPGFYNAAWSYVGQIILNFSMYVVHETAIV